MGSSCDIAIVGAGLIGLATARELALRGACVAVYERGCAGREASWAGAGMLAASQFPPESPLLALARASADAYPAFVADVQAASGQRIDYGATGTVVACRSNSHVFAGDHYVDNRQLTAAMITAARAAGVTLHERCLARGIARGNGFLTVRTDAEDIAATHVVNCAGAWAGRIESPFTLPVRPRKGQILALRPRSSFTLNRVMVGEDVYLVPRADGRIIVGATVEDAGFDKTVDDDVIAHLRAAAERLLPELADAELVEKWAGLRPGTPDDLPLIGETPVRGYWAATGHFRDGILLAPVTALLMADLIEGKRLNFNLEPFSPLRFK